MHVAARPRIPDSAALIFARWAESVPGLDRWPRGACAGDDHGRKAARATRPHFECEYQPKPENGVGVSRGRTFCRRIAFVAGRYSAPTSSVWDGSRHPGLRSAQAACAIGVVSQLSDISALLQDLRKPLGYQRCTGSLTGTRMCSLAPLKSKQSGNAARTARAGRLCKPVRPCCVSAWWS